jgi:hypothetical protein
MYALQRLLFLSHVNIPADEVLYSERPGVVAVDEQLVTLTLAEWGAMGNPDTITTKIEPGDTRGRQTGLIVDL